MYFSVVIPLYNKEKHIKRAIFSVLEQSHQNFEIIVVDDGSTDNSYKEVEEIDDSRIKLFSKENEGVSSARNFGIKKARYDYIALLDADDMWKPTFLSAISNLIKQYPEAGAYATSYEFRKQKITKPASINVDMSEGQSDVVDYFKGALKDPLITASSVVIKKIVFSDVGLFTPNLTRGEDLEMWCRIALKYKVVFLNEVLSIYSQDSDNKLTNTKRVYSKSFISQVENILNEQKNKGSYSFYFEEYMIGKIMSKVRFLILEGRNKEARKLLWDYKYTKYNRKKWLKNYLLSYKPIYLLYKSIK